MNTNFKPMQVAYYHPTPNFLQIREHIAVCWEDMTLVAVCGASPVDEDAKTVDDSRAYARLFAESPNLLSQLEATTKLLELSGMDDIGGGIAKTIKYNHEIIAKIRGVS
jgi:hypothetical protein